MRISKGVVAVLLALCVAGIAGERSAAKGATAKLSSPWGTRDIQTDASAIGPIPMAMFTSDSPFAIGLSNDRDFLYIVLRTSDAGMRARMLTEGLAVWFDPDGGTRRHFGIQYPTGQPGGGRMGGYGGRQRDTDPESMWAEAESSGALSAMDLLGPGKDDRLRQVVAKTAAPKVQISSVEGTVTYQIKVPLSSSGEYHYAIGTAPGSIMGMGLASPDVTNDSSRAAMGGGRGGGGRGGSGGGGGRGGGGRRGGGGGGGGQSADVERPKPLKEWTTVKLSSQE